MIKKDEKKYSIDCYKKFLSTIIVDKDLGKELIDQIDKVYKDGLVIVEGNSLFGKIMNKGKTDYIDIKYESGLLNCSYTSLNSRKTINIIQRVLNGNVKLEKREISETTCSSGLSETEVCEFEQIYGSKNKLLYESTITTNHDYKLSGNKINYRDRGTFFNKLCVNRKWFMSNGSIIRYRLTKNFLTENSELKETHLICVKPYIKDSTKRYEFVELDESLFKELMLQRMSIEEVIEQNKVINEQKMKKMNLGDVK